MKQKLLPISLAAIVSACAVNNEGTEDVTTSTYQENYAQEETDPSQQWSDEADGGMESYYPDQQESDNSVGNTPALSSNVDAEQPSEPANNAPPKVTTEVHDSEMVEKVIELPPENMKNMRVTVKYPKELESQVEVSTESVDGQSDLSGYTIQLIALKDGSSIDRFVLRLPKEQPSWEYTKVLENKTWVSILYGQYDTKTDAQRVLNSLPADLRRHQPFIIQFKNLKYEDIIPLDVN